MSDKSELKAELERKKQRIAQIREEKKRKEEEKKEEGWGGVVGPEDSAWRGRGGRRSLCCRAWASPPTSHTPRPHVSSNKSVGSDAGSQDSGDGNAGPRTLHWDPDPSTLQLHSDSELMGRGAVRLTSPKCPTWTFVPKELVSYCKETQTPTELTHPEEKSEEEEEEEDTSSVRPAEGAQEEDEQSEQEQDPPTELTEEQKLQLLNSHDFLSFLERGSRMVERALGETVDVCFDYSGRDLEDREGDLQAGVKLVVNRQFADERWSKNRVVTCLDWSPQYPELLVAPTTTTKTLLMSPMASLWSGTSSTRRERLSTSSTASRRSCPPALPGSTPTCWWVGLILDRSSYGTNRSNRRTPVQRTPLSAAAHTHPVYCVNVVGTPERQQPDQCLNRCKMCSWSLDMLSQPQDSLELVFKQSKAVAVTSMAFPLADVNNFVVGSEDGSVYTACRHGSKAGITDIFDGHHGPVTGLSCHGAGGPVDFSHLFISASFDWTVKLWSTKGTRPLYSFEDSCDYVYDAMWSPTHPALFACVDLAGRLDLWNLNNDTEVPTASVQVDGAPALNRVRWAHSGKEIATGDSEGHVRVYDVGEQICVPKADEWTRFARTLAEINESRDEAEELANV
ncbi:unnamed protein product [Lampetra planeri]